jgi:hypothetical protein
MPQNASVPAETDTLCEHCGYGLNGLPTGGLCPECGQPIADSTTDDGRTLPAWESGGSRWSRYFRTTRGVVLTPADFFRHLQTRVEHDESGSFVSMQHGVAAVLLGLTAAIHFDAMGLFQSNGTSEIVFLSIFSPFLMILTYLSLTGVTRIASTLTRWEGNYWGYRLPAKAVRRVMNYHAAQMIPVSIAALLTVGTYRLLRGFGLLDGLWDIKYLVAICIEVLVAAAYLFRTYWIAMKNVMYANR